MELLAGPLASRALEVYVLDAKDERALVMPREQPVEQRGARPADMEIAGGGGGKTEARRSR